MRKGNGWDRVAQIEMAQPLKGLGIVNFVSLNKVSYAAQKSYLAKI